MKFRLLLASLVTGVLLFATAGSALAHECTVVAKPDGAGSAGSVTINLGTGEFTFDLNMNAAGQVVGAFAALTIILPDGTVLGPSDVMVHLLLPEGALNSGPGDNFCDGKGIDEVSACWGIP